MAGRTFLQNFARGIAGPIGAPTSRGIVFDLRDEADVVAELTQTLDKSNASPDVKKSVERLAQEIAEIVPQSDPEIGKQLVHDLKVLGYELALPRPRRAWCEMSLNGLRDGALAIGDKAQPITSAIANLANLKIGM
jgi:hypothetical protein